jgi:hypothetical protein
VPGSVQGGAEVVQEHGRLRAAMVEDDDAARGTLGQWCICKDVGRTQCEEAACSYATVNTQQDSSHTTIFKGITSMSINM